MMQKRFFYRFGFIAALFTSVITTITFAIAVMTPPLSGPFCTAGCFEYPYTDIILRFPRDYYWMYPAMLVFFMYMVLMSCIHEYAAPEKKLFSRIGMGVAVISAGILITNYFIQVSVIQPSLLRGETDGIALISQYNPHGIFIAMEEIGFMLMCISFLAVVPVFSGHGVLKGIRITFITAFLLAVFSLIFVALRLGLNREYVFEIIIISIVWLELIIASVMISTVFHRELKE